MSVNLVSTEPCWALPAGDTYDTGSHIHFADRETALREATDRLKHWRGDEPLSPFQEPELCWVASCDECEWSYDEEEICDLAHLPGDAKGPSDEVFSDGNGSIGDVLFWTPDGRLLCVECREAAQASPRMVDGQESLPVEVSR